MLWTDTHKNNFGGLTTPKMGLKTMRRRPKSNIKMDGSVGEAFISLELNFTEENGCHRFLI